MWGKWIISIKVSCHHLWAGGSAWGDLGQEMDATFSCFIKEGLLKAYIPRRLSDMTGDPEGFVVGAGEARFKHYSPRSNTTELTCYTEREEELLVHSRKSQGRLPGPSVCIESWRVRSDHWDD